MEEKVDFKKSKIMVIKWKKKLVKRFFKNNFNGF